MRIVFVYADNKKEWNSSEWRCVIPAKAIDRSPDHQARLLAIADFANRTPAADQLCSQADVIVVERNLFGPVLTAIMHWKARGKGVIANFDDAYHLLPADNLSHDFWINGEIEKNQNGSIVKDHIDPPPITQFKWGLRMVDGAVVASQKLVEDWEEFTDVRHLPMFLDFSRYQDLPEKESGQVVIGWSGSLSHLHSFSTGILQALERVARTRPQVKLKIGNDRRIYDKLKVPEDQKELTPWVPYEEWPQVLASYDIGLAPMEGEFDARRSWVKVLEYMAVKTPWIASRSPAYQELESYGQLVENSAYAWEENLLNLIDNLEKYQLHAQGPAFNFSISQNADSNIERMIMTFNSIINRR
jgi:glycosyltransferase involved in cell wall biosynthesis